MVIPGHAPQQTDAPSMGDGFDPCLCNQLPVFPFFPYPLGAFLPQLTNSPDVFAALRLHQLLPVGWKLLVCVQGDPVARAGPGPGSGAQPGERS